MARLRFEMQAVRTRRGSLAAGVEYVVYSDDDGTVLADIAASSGGSSIPGSTVTVADQAGLGPSALLFWGPTDDTDVLWLRCPSDSSLGVQEIEADVSGGGGGGVTDHGALTGLADDDHSQYATDADVSGFDGRLDVLEGVFANTGIVDLAAPPHNLTASDITSALQAVITAATGSRRAFRLPPGNSTITSTQQVNQPGVVIMGNRRNRTAEWGATQLSYTGTGPLFQIGTDTGNAPYDFGYDGPGGFTLLDVGLKYTGTTDTPLENGLADYKAGTYGILDWGGGDILLERVSIENFDQGIWGTFSDINNWHDLVILACHRGIYLAVSDQLNCYDFHTFYCDTAIEIDSSRNATFHAPRIIQTGSATTYPISVHSGGTGKAADQVVFNQPWLEHLEGPTDTVNAFFSIGAADATATATVVIRDPFYYTGVGGFQTDYLASIGNAQMVLIDNPDSPTPAALVKLVEFTGTTSPACHVRSGAAFTTRVDFDNAGSGSPVFSTEMIGLGHVYYDNAAAELLFKSNGFARSKATSRGLAVGAGTPSWGDAVAALAMQNAITVPSTNPVGGGVLYAEGGALKWRGSSGTVTTIAPA